METDCCSCCCCCSLFAVLATAAGGVLLLALGLGWRMQRTGRRRPTVPGAKRNALTVQ